MVPSTCVTNIQEVGLRAQGHLWDKMSPRPTLDSMRPCQKMKIKMESVYLHLGMSR